MKLNILLNQASYTDFEVRHYKSFCSKNVVLSGKINAALILVQWICTVVDKAHDSYIVALFYYRQFKGWDNYQVP